MTSYQVIQSDILKWAKDYNGPKFHAILCDPPYHLTSVVKRFSKGEPEHTKTARDIANRATPHARQAAGFMNQSWDGTNEQGTLIAFQPETWEALANHLYPGAFIMAFAATRGYHRMATAMEDAGLIIHPALGYLFGTGFPKATQISNQVERAIIEPNTELAKIWQSHRYGLQALKPAFEFIAVAQRPYEGRAVDNIVSTGAGALNIDAGRIATTDSLDGGGYMTPVSEGWNRPWRHNEDIRDEKERIKDERVSHAQALGRWPSNFLIHHEPGCNGDCVDGCPVRVLGEQSGETGPGGDIVKTDGSKPGYSGGLDNRPWESYGDSGTAARFFFQANWHYEILEQIQNADPVFYTAKAGKTEREAGLGDLPTRTRNRVNSGGLENEPRFAPTQVKNNHPTIKSISLTKYLASLLLPPEAYAPRRILIPFAGAGSEMIGALLAGWDEITGIEQGGHYCEIARHRLAWWSRWPGWGQRDVDKILQAATDRAGEAGQMSLFDLMEQA